MELPIYYWAEEHARTRRSRLTLLERLRIWLGAIPNQIEEVYRHSANAVPRSCARQTHAAFHLARICPVEARSFTV